MNSPIKKSLELKRSIMLGHGLRLPDQMLDEMKLGVNEDGDFVVKFKAIVRTGDFKGVYRSCE